MPGCLTQRPGPWNSRPQRASKPRWAGTHSRCRRPSRGARCCSCSPSTFPRSSLRRQQRRWPLTTTVPLPAAATWRRRRAMQLMPHVRPPRAGSMRCRAKSSRAPTKDRPSAIWHGCRSSRIPRPGRRRAPCRRPLPVPRRTSASTASSYKPALRLRCTPPACWSPRPFRGKTAEGVNGMSVQHQGFARRRIPLAVAAGDFRIARGYYLYRDRFSIATQAGRRLAELDIPRPPLEQTVKVSLRAGRVR